MNERPWPLSNTITPVDTSADSSSEIQQVFAALNSLITQFNQLTSLQGNLELQISSLIKRLGGLYPYDGIHNSGYITNSTLLNWPGSSFTVGVDGGTSEIPLFDIDLSGDSPVTTFTEDAGALNILGGGLYFDTTHSSGIYKDSNNAYVKVNGYDALELTQSDADTGTITAYGGAFYLDSDHDYGVAITGTDLELGCGSGEVSTLGIVNASGGFASGTQYGDSISTGGLTFYKGLYISGTMTGTGSATDPGDDDQFYLRYHENGVEDAVWYNLDTFLPGIIAGDPWAGSDSIETVGTISSGTWHGDAIEYDYIYPIMSNTILGNYSGSADNPCGLTVSEVREMLSIDAVENTSLSTWDGSGQITTLGTITQGTWHGTDIGLSYIENISANRLLGNNTGVSASPLALSVTDVKTMLSLNNVENTALSSWTGSANITTLGAITTCPSLVTTGRVTAESVKCNGILPVSSSASACGFTNYAGNNWILRINTTGTIDGHSWGDSIYSPLVSTAHLRGASGVDVGELRFSPGLDGTSAFIFNNAACSAIAMRIDTTNRIVYPNRLVIPLVS